MIYACAACGNHNYEKMEMKWDSQKHKLNLKCLRCGHNMVTGPVSPKCFDPQPRQRVELTDDESHLIWQIDDMLEGFGNLSGFTPKSRSSNKRWWQQICRDWKQFKQEVFEQDD